MYLVTVVKEKETNSSYDVDKEQKLVEYRTDTLNIPQLLADLAKNAADKTTT